MSEQSAAQQYFDPPDEPEYTFACTVEIDVTARNEDEAYDILRRVLGGKVNDWYLDDIREYGGPLW
jgi:hypothetical protein